MNEKNPSKYGVPAKPKRVYYDLADSVYFTHDNEAGLILYFSSQFNLNRYLRRREEDKTLANYLQDKYNINAKTTTYDAYTLYTNIESRGHRVLDMETGERLWQDRVGFATEVVIIPNCKKP